ncbi:MAG TPA: hypothetical protein VKT82_26865 [Ktedonobacterales bacterium]|nr:hypothetical protein [Ktedonobacterales bacterium]
MSEISPIRIAVLLGYGLVLIVPFLRHFANVSPGHTISLVVYVIVLVYSGALAIYYLFLKCATRCWALLPRLRPARRTLASEAAPIGLTSTRALFTLFVEQRVCCNRGKEALSGYEERTWHMKNPSKALASSWLVYWAGVVVGIIPWPLAVVGLVRFPSSTVLVLLTYIPGFAVAAYVAELVIAVLCLFLSRLRPLGQGILTGLLISTIGWHLTYIFLPIFFISG